MQRTLNELLKRIITDYVMLNADFKVMLWYKAQRDLIDELPNENPIHTYLKLREIFTGGGRTPADEQIINLIERTIN